MDEVTLLVLVACGAFLLGTIGGFCLGWDERRRADWHWWKEELRKERAKYG